MRKGYVLLSIVVAWGCSSDSTEQKTHAPCEAKACGDSCQLCAPSDADCNETAVEKYCQPDGSCSAGKPTCDNTYNACKEKACGDSCTICPPGETGCTETAVEKFCQTDGSCNASKPSCNGAYAPCKGKSCGDDCRLCAPDDADCNETAVEKYCQADGSCSAVKPACDATCGDSVPTKEFESCRDAEDARACLESGGEWAQPGSSNRFSCVCPTGEGDCPCKSADDCLGACTAPMSGMDFESCKKLTEGSCTASFPVLGCRCWFEDGVAMGACAD